MLQGNLIDAGSKILSGYQELQLAGNELVRQVGNAAGTKLSYIKENDQFFKKITLLAIAAILLYSSPGMMACGFASSKLLPVEDIKKGIKKTWQSTEAGKLLLTAAAFMLLVYAPYPAAAFTFGGYAGSGGLDQAEERPAQNKRLLDYIWR